MQVVGETQELMRDIVRQHVETYDEDNMRDFVDVYLREMKTTADVSFTGSFLLLFQSTLRLIMNRRATSGECHGLVLCGE